MIKINYIGNTPKDTQKKHGFVYSDVSMKRAQNKAYTYRLLGFDAVVAIRSTGYFVVIR